MLTIQHVTSLNLKDWHPKEMIIVELRLLHFKRSYRLTAGFVCWKKLYCRPRLWCTNQGRLNHFAKMDTYASRKIQKILQQKKELACLFQIKENWRRLHFLIHGT